MDMQTWFEEHFKPWRDDMEQRAAERSKYGKLVKANVQAVKHVVGLIHDGRGRDAAEAWNALGFDVLLRSIDLTQDGQWLEVTPVKGERTAVPVAELTTLLNELLTAG